MLLIITFVYSDAGADHLHFVYVFLVSNYFVELWGYISITEKGSYLLGKNIHPTLADRFNSYSNIITVMIVLFIAYPSNIQAVANSDTTINVSWTVPQEFYTSPVNYRLAIVFETDL